MKRIAALLAGTLALGGCVVAPVAVERPAAVAWHVGTDPGLAPATVPAGMQYLYGSGEAAAASWQAYAALVRYVAEVVRVPPPGRGARPMRDRGQVVLPADATLDRPGFVPCGTLPKAVVLDVDETVLLNTGYEYSDARGGLSFDAARWERWERADGGAVAAVPGAVEALNEIRRFGVTVVFNSNRNAATAAQTEAALTRLGLGPARHGTTLFLKGDAPGGSAKDARRALIAGRYCVIALVGDQLGDFADLFNAGLAPPQRRAAATRFADLWGNGWFVLPNPVYGTALAGDFDQVFPADQRWADPGAAKE